MWRRRSAAPAPISGDGALTPVRTAATAVRQPRWRLYRGKSSRDGAFTAVKAGSSEAGREYAGQPGAAGGSGPGAAREPRRGTGALEPAVRSGSKGWEADPRAGTASWEQRSPGNDGTKSRTWRCRNRGQAAPMLTRPIHRCGETRQSWHGRRQREKHPPGWPTPAGPRAHPRRPARAGLAHAGLAHAGLAHAGLAHANSIRARLARAGSPGRAGPRRAGSGRAGSGPTGPGRAGSGRGRHRAGGARGLRNARAEHAAGRPDLRDDPDGRKRARHHRDRQGPGHLRDRLAGGELVRNAHPQRRRPG